MNHDQAVSVILPATDRLTAKWQSGPAPLVENPSALSGISDVLWPGKWLIFGCGLLCAVAALTFSYRQTPLYRAKTALEIQDLNGNFLQLGELDPVARRQEGDDSYVQARIEELTSSALLSRVVTSLHMDDQFKNTKPSQLALIRTRLLSPGTSIDSPKEQAITEARSNLDVATSRGSSRIVNIQYTSPDPQFAANFVNTLAQSFVTRGIELRMQGTQRTREWLQKEADSLRAKLQSSEDQLQQYGQAQGLLFTDEKNSVAEAKLKQLQGELSQAQADRIAKQSKFELVTKTTPEGLAQLTDHGPLREYELKLTDARQQLAESQSLLTPSHYKVKQLQARVTELEAALTNARKEIADQTVSEFTAAQRREALLSAAYAQQARLVSAQDAKASRYNILKGEVESNRQLYDSMLQKVKNVSIASAMRASNVAIVDPAEVPTHPFQPRPLMNGMAGLMGGVLLSSIFLFLQHRWDRSLKTPGQVSDLLGIPELGTVPSVRNTITPARKAGASLTDPPVAGGSLLNALGEPQEALASVVANSFRAIIASLTVAGAKQHSSQIITVTSAWAKEGKTTTAINLAITLVSIGKRVLLVDGDFVKPRLHHLFDLPEGRGFSDLLMDRAAKRTPLADYIQKISATGLSVLTGGSVRAQAWSTLYGAQLSEALNEFRKDYDVIIIDTPPVLAVADARLLCRQSDGVVLVCRAGTTDRESARSAVERLTSDGARLYGTILNDFDPRTSRYYKNYYAYDEAARTQATNWRKSRPA